VLIVGRGMWAPALNWVRGHFVADRNARAAAADKHRDARESLESTQGAASPVVRIRLGHNSAGHSQYAKSLFSVVPGKSPTNLSPPCNVRSNMRELGVGAARPLSIYRQRE
jgi:hypothetical protein